MTIAAGPKSVDLFDPFALDDPYPVYERLRATEPVYRLPGTNFFLVSTWETVVEAAGRTDDFSSNLRGIMVYGPNGVPTRFSMDLDGAVEQVLATADGAAHRAHRKLVLRALGRRIRVLEDAVAEFTQTFWDEHLVDGRIDWVHAMADRLPPAVLARLVGLPDADIPRVLSWAYESVELLGGLASEERLNVLIESTLALNAYLTQQLLSAMEERRDDLLGVLAAAHRDGEITVEVAVLVLMQLVGAGAETTAGLLGSAARLLAEDPALQDRLRSEPELIDPFLDECLRLETPLRGHYRHAVRDSELGGVPVPAGSDLLLLWAAANRDPAHIDRPEDLDLTRPSVRQHLAFGKGVHFCLGSSLARLEAGAAVRLLLRETSSFRLDPDDRPSWVPSIIVRRHRRLPLVVEKAAR